MGDSEWMTGAQFERQDGTDDWRILRHGATGWFGADSHAAGARLVRRIADDLGTAFPLVDLRADGLRITIRSHDGRFGADDAQAARTISAAAADLGLTADPSRLQDLQVAIDTLDASRLQPFWQRVLGYDARGAEDLEDPLHRLPPVWFQQQDEPRPLRNRIHLDVMAPVEVAAAVRADLAGLGGRLPAGRPYLVVDADGNEADLGVLEGDRWPDAEADDWRLVFPAMAAHRAPSPQQALAFVETVAGLADEAGVALGIDLRDDLVVLDSVKDAWEGDDRYRTLAIEVQRAARQAGLRAEPDRARFVQAVIDAADIPALRAFWRAALGYEDDPRPDVTDIVDPRRLSMPLVFQHLEDDPDRRAQRNRIHLDVYLPQDQAEARVRAAVAAGGTIVREDEAPFWVTVADPEGNEVDLAVIPGRAERWGEGG